MHLSGRAPCSPVRRMAGNATAENPKQAKPKGSKDEGAAAKPQKADAKGPKKAKRSGGKKSKFKR